MTLISQLLLLSTMVTLPQSSTHNYILTKTMLDNTGTLSLNKIDYYDGLGRPVQTVQHKLSPGGTDIVTLQEYDGAGRPFKSYLPASVITTTGAYVLPTEFKTVSNIFYSDSRTFEETVYESSPLNRVDKVYGPGSAWYSNDKSVTTSRHTNGGSGELSCALYAVTSPTSLQRKGLYSAGELYVTKITGEDGLVSYTFTDKLGQVVLERVMNGTIMNDTYYVYDDFGNLRYVLPPEASDALTTNSTWVDSHLALTNYAYVYKYDGRNRCIQKRIPGIDPVEMRYDRVDRRCGRH